MKTKLIITTASLLTFSLLVYYALDRYLPKEIHIEKPVAIGDSSTSVFEKINSSANWEQWMVWLKSEKQQVDSTALTMHFGADEGEGAGIQWSETEKFSSGKFFIMKSYEPDSIIYEMSLKNYGTGYGSFHFRKYNKGVYLTWSFRISSDNNFYSRYKLISLKKQMAAIMEESQQFLKSLCEYEATHHIDMSYSNLPECDYLYIRDECFAPEISERMSRHFSEILKYIAQQKIKQEGFPFCMYHKVSDTMNFSVCIPVEKSTAEPSEKSIKKGHLNPDMTIAANYHGHYSSLGNAHAAVQQWITEGKKKISGDPIEMYITGPDEIADSSRWLTKIFYPVE